MDPERKREPVQLGLYRELRQRLKERRREDAPNLTAITGSKRVGAPARERRERMREVETFYL